MSIDHWFLVITSIGLFITKCQLRKLAQRVEQLEEDKQVEERINPLRFSEPDVYTEPTHAMTTIRDRAKPRGGDRMGTSGTVAEWLTVRETATATGWPTSTIRWHCRSERGMLHEHARRTTNGFLIPGHCVAQLKRARVEFEVWRRQTRGGVMKIIHLFRKAPGTAHRPPMTVETDSYECTHWYIGGGGVLLLSEARSLSVGPDAPRVDLALWLEPGSMMVVTE